MQPIIGQLFRNKGIEISIYGKPLVNASAIDINKAHKSVALHEENKLRLRESYPFSSSDELALRTTPQKGESVILHNRTAGHARTDYQDWPKPEQRRHLLRI